MSDKRIEVHVGDITRVAVDAIVNAANERMLGGGGVDGAIHAAAGPKLLEACRAVVEVAPNVRCPTGETRATPAFDLPARWVLHTVGPVWRGGNRGERELLASCYSRTLALAAELGARSIAFPAISCGVYRFPVRLAAGIAVGEITAFLRETPEFERVVLVAFEQGTADALSEELGGAISR